ncbi:hypothetical protein AB0D08_13155, partial [Kitasatospora sp. NPDC048540]
ARRIGDLHVDLVPAAGGAGGGPPPADPVRELIVRHRAVCEQAVDALEIAAALEDAGIGAGTVGRYRHADVFALAEELYARVPRRLPEPEPPGRPEPWARSGRPAVRGALGHGLPAVLLFGVGLALPGLTGPAVLALLLPAAAVLALAAPAGSRPVRGGYGLGLALLLAPAAGQVLGPASGGPDGPDALLAAVAVLGAAPAAWAAGWLRRTGLGHLGAAPTMAEFRARMLPVLPVAVLAQLAVLGVLTFAALAAAGPSPGPASGDGLLHGAAHRAGQGQWAAQAAVGLLLVLVAALLRCGRPVLAATALPVAALAALVLPAVLPGVGAAGARLLACGGAAVVLLPYAWSVFGRPGAYRGGAGEPGG